MSYSIQARGATKEEAKKNIAEQFDSQVIPSQPIHSRDRDAALAAAGAMIDLLTDEVPENQVIHIHLSGSVSWNSYPLDQDLQSTGLLGASANASARYGAKL